MQEKINNSDDEFSKYKLIGNVIAANIEARDTYLNIRSIITNTKKQINTAKEFIAKKAPQAVATPLPPLKFKNMVKICPIMTARATAIIIQYEEGFVNVIRYTGIKPFKTSSNNVKTPNGLLIVL